MTSTLLIGKKIEGAAGAVRLPLETVTQTMAILARRGAGKTYTGNVLVEEVVAAKIPTVVLDPTGAWWGLRSSADGLGPGLPVAILGGDHGDVPLRRGSGKEIAAAVIDSPSAYVIDLSAFESKGLEIAWTADFLEALYRKKKAETGPLFLVVDEADMFAPQRPGPEQTNTLGSLESIWRRGRIKGLGGCLITQRAAVLNKNVLTQTEILVLMQTTGPQDRDAVDAWISGNGSTNERKVVLESLASLKRGEAWIWSPSFLRMLARVQIRQRRTFDSSRTPGVGEAPLVAKEFAQVDVAALDARIAKAVEDVKENDPVLLKSKVRTLEDRIRQLEARPPVEVVREVPVESVERVEIPVFEDDDIATFRAVRQDVDDLRDRLAAIDKRLELNVAGAVAPPVDERKPWLEVVVPMKPAAIPREIAPKPDADDARVGPSTLGKAERTFLSAIVASQDGLSRSQLAMITGYSAKSSHFGNTLSRLRVLGLIESGTPLRPTQAGVDALPEIEPLPRPGRELVEYWYGRLAKAEKAFLEIFVEAYPSTVDKATIADRTGYSPSSSHFGNTLSRLRVLGLVEGMAASKELMG
jgi:hypothetical protein